MKPPSKVVLVTWRDCFVSQGTWKGAEEPPDEDVIVQSAGWLVPDYKKRYIVLSDAWFEADSELYFGTLTYIPDKMVVSVTELKV